MKILQVIHRYPPYYRAGSETYTYLLARELARRKHEVTVFTRIENSFRPPYSIMHSLDNGVSVIRVNRPVTEYRLENKYLDEKIEEIYENLLLELDPDVVHVGHLSHLSTNIVDITKKHNYPLVFTLHDYWMVCLRGQLITRTLELCDGPSVDGCTNCFAFYFSNLAEGREHVKLFLSHMERIRELVDHYIAPTQFLLNVYVRLGIPRYKISLLDYGFDANMFKRFKKESSSKN